MTAPLVSVVIPTYNRADLLPQALESVFSQTYGRVEVLVVDDGSTDTTASVLDSYGQRLRWFRQANAGPSAARNRGIAEAQGTYVAFLDSDDLWLPTKLEQQVAVFREHPGTGMVGGGCRYIDAAGHPLPGETRCPPVLPLEDFQIFTALPGSASNATIRKDVLDHVGGFDPTLLRAEDRDLWIRIAERYPVRGVPEPTVLIRVHGGPRPNDSFALVRESRRRVNEKIGDRAVRRKADAWMWYSFGERRLAQGRTLEGIAYLLRSFLLHPTRVTARKRRLVPTLVRLLPPWLVELGRRAIHSSRHMRG